jgi:uncharacterized protein HemY
MRKKYLKGNAMVQTKVIFLVISLILIILIFYSLLASIGVHRGVSKRLEDGRRTPATLQAGHA